MHDQDTPLNAVQPDSIEFGGRTIRFLRFQPVTGSIIIAALVIIEPPTTKTVPDLALGFGRIELEAKAAAFEVAKQQISKNSV